MKLSKIQYNPTQNTNQQKPEVLSATQPVINNQHPSDLNTLLALTKDLVAELRGSL